MLRLFFLFIFLCSCSTIKPSSKSTEQLLDSIQVTGEGKGRLGAQGHEYVVGVESLLKDEDTYLLALNIPTRGEEVLVLKDLKNPKVSHTELIAFQKRLNNSLNPKFLVGMRSLLRLALASELKLVAHCSEHECTLGDETYQVKRSSDKMLVEKIYEDGSRIQMEGENLTDTNFSRTNFRLISPSSSGDRMSFEFFWST